MNGLMMDYPLTLPAILRRAEALASRKEIVSRLPDKRLHRYTYADFARRARQLASALHGLDVAPGDRVATLCWNHHQHLEAYFGIPLAGAVLHTLNLRLHPDDLVYIMNHAGDKVLLVDAVLLPLFERLRERVSVSHVVAITDGGKVPEGMLDYEALLARASGQPFAEPALDENQAAAMCYTTGTTGRPKGVLYSHRAIALHSLALCLADTLGLRESDVALPVVPMFHANAWGLPFACAMVGAKQVFPGSHLDPRSLAELYQGERVTLTGGVPTIWMGLLEWLDSHPGSYDLSSLRVMLVGGSAAPPAMIRAFQERHNLRVLHAWGMTEMTPLGTVAMLTSELEGASQDEQYAYRGKQGRPAPFVEVRGRGEEGLVPWDGKSPGELEVRGPWVARSYYGNREAADCFTDDGWFRTGDIATIDPHGYIQIQDRTKDVIKSGGEWISSVALENALMGHPAVAEAAVIAIPHPRWHERPLAVVVLKEGRSAGGEELRAHLASQFAKWWVPDAIEFVSEIPRTSTGKFQKSVLRQQFKDYRLP
ncbi:MAG: long-chain fatty acid--CoA ligase [Acidobacteria bacterium]|nr:long-chain fatty acid--CoA ligase [Acidobacteriota bacterium]